MTIASPRRLVAFVFAAALAACAPSIAPHLPSAALTSASGSKEVPREVAARATATVITFFSTHCDCQRAHDARLNDLVRRFSPRGVAFLAIDSEADATPAGDAAEAGKRGYAFPILMDPDGAFADALGAEYATYSVVIDAAGRVRYRGGFDSDRKHLVADATPYLANAIESVLAGKDPNPAEVKTLGCSLRRK